MAIRFVLVATMALTLAGCGGSSAERNVAVVAPVWIGADVGRFERESGCRVDLRVYDEGEDIPVIADRRDADVVATPAPRGGDADQSEDFIHITLDGGLEITVPKRLASAFDGPSRPAGRRGIVWLATRRGSGDPLCVSRWLDYATSQ